MEKSKVFEVRHLVNLEQNQSFSIFNNNFENIATMIIKDETITVYFKDDEQKSFGSNYQELLDWANENNYIFMKFVDGDHRWHKFNPNPEDRNIGDCTLRSYCAAFDIDWNKAFDIASVVAKGEASMIQYVAQKVLTEYFNCTVDESYNKKSVKKEDRMTVNQFAETHPYGTYILHTRSHQVTVKDGEYWDSYDSGDKKVDIVFLPPKKDK